MIFSLLLIAIILITAKETLFWAYILQLKEYRRDKLREYFKSPQGKASIFSKKYIIRIIVFLGLILVWGLIEINANNYNDVFFVLASLIIVADGCRSWRSLIRWIKKPDPTKRMMLIIITTTLINIAIIGAIIVAIIMMYNQFDSDEFFVTIYDIFRRYILPFYALQSIPRLPLLIAHLLILPLSIYQKKKILWQAKAYIARQWRTTIGISGSYGKSSVKMFLDAVLRSQYPVLTTPGNVNTEIGISQFVLTEWDSQTVRQWNSESGNNSKSKIHNPKSHFFICEMGTYAIGETAIIGGIVNHHYGFLTGLNNQHIDLFGSLANAITAESEILINLRRVSWTIYANRDDPLVRSVSFAWVTLVRYSITNPTADIYISDIIGQPWNYSFTFHDKRLGTSDHQRGTIVQTNVLGRHNILNLAGVIACALDQEISRENLQTIIKHIGEKQKTLHISIIPNHQLTNSPNIQLIDDTYNMNQHGVKAWLDLLSEYPTKKVVVIDEIIELGSESEETHRQIGQTLSRYDLDLIILTGKNYGTYIAAGYTGKALIIQSFIDWPATCLDSIKTLDTDVTIIFLGRWTQNLLQLLKK